MLLTRKKRNQETGEDEEFITGFAWKPNWFVLTQTEGEPVPIPDIPDWSKERAVTALHIQEVPFTETDGYVQGYAQKSQIEISSLATMAAKTLFHETAHVVLGHTQESTISDSEHLSNQCFSFLLLPGLAWYSVLTVVLIVARIDYGWSRLNGTTREARRWTSPGASW